MIIGVLKDDAPEHRVALIPENVKSLVARKVSVLVEQGAGTNAFYPDESYSEAGATVQPRTEVLENRTCWFRSRNPMKN